MNTTLPYHVNINKQTNKVTRKMSVMYNQSGFRTPTYISMELLVKNCNEFKPLNIFTKSRMCDEF